MRRIIIEENCPECGRWDGHPFEHEWYGPLRREVEARTVTWCDVHDGEIWEPSSKCWVETFLPQDFDCNFVLASLLVLPDEPLPRERWPFQYVGKEDK